MECIQVEGKKAAIKTRDLREAWGEITESKRVAGFIYFPASQLGRLDIVVFCQVLAYYY